MLYRISFRREPAKNSAPDLHPLNQLDRRSFRTLRAFCLSIILVPPVLLSAFFIPIVGYYLSRTWWRWFHIYPGPLSFLLVCAVLILAITAITYLKNCFRPRKKPRGLFSAGLGE